MLARRAVAHGPEPVQARHRAGGVHGDAAARVARDRAVEPVRRGTSAHGGQHHVGPQLASVDEPDAVGPDLRDGRTGDEVGARRGVPGREVHPDHRSELAAQRRVRGLDDGDARARTRRDPGQLGADPAGADDHEAEPRSQRAAQGLRVLRGVQQAGVVPSTGPDRRGADREHDGVGDEAFTRAGRDLPRATRCGAAVQPHGGVGEVDVVREPVDVHAEVVGEPRRARSGQQLLRQRRPVVRGNALRSEERDPSRVPAAPQRADGLGAGEPRAHDEDGRGRVRDRRRTGRAVRGGRGEDRRLGGRHARHARPRR